jgi:hypothetical protein
MEFRQLSIMRVQYSRGWRGKIWPCGSNSDGSIPNGNYYITHCLSFSIYFGVYLKSGYSTTYSRGLKREGDG